jgi:hypothetical protein
MGAISGLKFVISRATSMTLVIYIYPVYMEDHGLVQDHASTTRRISWEVIVHR